MILFTHVYNSSPPLHGSLEILGDGSVPNRLLALHIPGIGGNSPSWLQPSGSTQR